TDSVIDAPSRYALRDIASVSARDTLTAVFHFRRRYAEMFFDAVYHMRVLPPTCFAHYRARLGGPRRSDASRSATDRTGWCAGRRGKVSSSPPIPSSSSGAPTCGG